MADPNYADMLRAAMDAQGITDPTTRTALAAVTMGESNMMGYVEHDYAHTANERIREVFGDRVPEDDDELNALKANPEAFFNQVYGPNTNSGHQLGNTQPGDGYKYRGRYAGQITGRGNYTVCGNKAGHPEVIDDPDVGIRNPAIGMAVTCAYAIIRYRGGGIDGMMKAFGNNTPDIRATKISYFNQFTASGEFAQVGAVPAQPIPPVVEPQPQPFPAPRPPVPPAVDYSDVEDAIKQLQIAFNNHGWDVGPPDGIWGDKTEAAFGKYEDAQG